MPPAATVSSARSPDVANRRLAVGLLLSVLLHALVLSVQFGIPGLKAGSPAPLTITLARAPQSVPLPEPALPVAAAPMPVAPPSAGGPTHGLRLVGPVAPAEPEPAPVPAKRQRSPARRPGSTSPRRPQERLKERVIAQERNPEATFAVPLPEPEEALETTPDRMAVQEGSDTGNGQASAKVEEAAPDPRKQEELLARERAAAEAEAQRQADEQARRVLALQEEQARRQAEQRARLLALQRDEQIRQERQAALEAAAREQAEEESRQATLRQRALDELAARQQAEQLAVKRQAEDAARREEAELAARHQAELLAQQRAAAQLAERRKAEELAQQQAREDARQQAEQATRRAAELAAIAQPARANESGAGGTPLAASTDGMGTGGAGGRAALPRSALGSDLAHRARELVRGIELPGGVPAAARPAHEEQLARRRAVSWGLDRDVPLRLYIDSFRQKIERNGVLSGARFDAGRVRTDPLVSVAIRSDGSVEEVIIVRSSGRPDTDEAVRNIIRLNARYAAFPPNVAARFDVIEIRRIWAFAEGLKLLEEVR